MPTNLSAKRNMIELPVQATLLIEQSIVQESSFSATKYKGLSVNIMDDVRCCGDSRTMIAVAKTVEKWTRNDISWVNEVLCFCKENEEIQSVYIGNKENIKEIIFTVDDSTSEDVLEYNDFMFNIREKYDEVHDFMVIDKSMKEVLDAMYLTIESIYTRG